MLGLWWLSLPLLAAGAWLYFRDGRMSRAKVKA
jgi:lipopolysaccharide export system permease protein